MIAAGRDRRDGVIQNALLPPTRRQFVMFQPRSLLAGDISGTMLEELPKGLSRCLIERRRVERRRHMLQPRAPLGGANPEPRVRFPHTQPPAALGLLFIPAEELNEEGGELFGGASEALAWEERTQDRIPCNTRVKSR